jgi:phospho-N-acetylmuramoyl-pentapeptide-transferase
MNAITLSIYAILLAFIINVILCPLIIPALRRLKFGQTVRDDGPQSHLVKNGTPTMGGVMIVLAFVLASLPFIWNGNHDAKAVLFITLGYGIVGFIDDYIKVVMKRSLGLRAWQKIVFQLIVTAIFFYYINSYTDLGTGIIIPFLGTELKLGIWYAPFLFFVMVGTVNSVNLTDGLDGLASGVTALVAVFFMIAALMLGREELSPVCGAVVGSLLGFLLFNSYPAKVFMGDTGSLALGGFVASTAVLLKMPLMLVIVGLIYVCESLSVILQVGYFKLTHGKRIFKMAPIHHHFEQCGLKETKVVALFYIITAIMCLIGYLAL